MLLVPWQVGLAVLFQSEVEATLVNIIALVISAAVLLAALERQHLYVDLACDETKNLDVLKHQYDDYAK